MSGRGRGGGRYANPSEFPSLHAGGGRGRGRGAGQGRGGRSTTASGYESAGSSSGGGAAMVASEMQQKLTLQPQPSGPAAPQPKIVAPTASSKAMKFAQRPGYGTVGRKCLIRANHFLMELADTDLHHYDVTISPEVTSRRVNRAVMKQLIETHGASHFGGLQPAYDGRKGLYTASGLPFSSKEFVIKLADKDKDAKSGGSGSKIKREREFKVSIKFASKADMLHLKEFLGGRQRDAPHETIQVLDVVLRESPSNKCTVVGRSFFSSSWGEKTEIGAGAECWKGFYQSLRPTQMGMSLNIDVSATAFYETITVIEFAIKFLNVDPARAASFPLSDSDIVKLKKAVRGVRVKVTHGKSKVYKVTGLSPQATNRLVFSDDDRQKKSVVQYFHEKYNIALRYASWPALQCGSDSRPIYIPMETCKIIEGQRYSRKLNERQVTALLREACKRPNIRQSTIETIAKHNSYEEDPLTTEFGVNVIQQLTSIDARILPAPAIKYHDSGRDKVIQPRTGAWNMINARMFKGATIKAWTCINFSSLHEQIAISFCRDLISMCHHKGVDIQAAPIIPIQSARSNQIERALTNIHTQCTANGGALQLLIVILPDITGSYGKIKRICETELGIVSQCCQPKQARKSNPQYLENLVLKINVKAGGQNAVWEDALNRRVPPLTDCPTIVFGADVTHPQPGEDTSPSIAAVVASMDWPTVATYKALVSSQGHREEIIQDLFKKVQDPVRGEVSSGMVRELLMAFRRSTGHKPQRIIFYRDGVSEGQFSLVLLQEMDAIRKACQSLEDSYLPPVTFVIVQKRHHTRLFPTNQKDTDRSGNILPGTVVDTKICHPFKHDFYLCSHAGIQGTSRPAHYHVLFDENNFNANALQMLTNNLCYTYARCTRSVSVVPPAYYAHLAAFRARYYIEGDTPGSDSASSSGAGGARREAAAFRPLPSMSPNVKEIMFFC